MLTVNNLIGSLRSLPKPLLQRVILQRVILRRVILRRVNPWLRRQIDTHSLVGCGPYFDSTMFPWAIDLEEHWEDIRRELDVVLRRQPELPNIQDFSPGDTVLTNDDQWKTYFFRAYGIDFPGNMESCPRTTNLLKKIPGLQTAFFSILSAGKEIPPHRGPHNGVIRYHLGLKIPDPPNQCGITVGGVTAHWREGRGIFFDDTFFHSAWNHSKDVRVVLFVDVARPLREPFAFINYLNIRRISRTAYIQNSKISHDAWERKFRGLRTTQKN